MCHDPQTVARRYFVVTPYEKAGDRLLPQLPDTCPLGVADGQACRLFTDHFRARKTGPRFALCVMRCDTHEIGFTLYPPGYTPWGRKPWVREGGVAQVEEEVEDNNPAWWRNTYFDAALEAAAGAFWPREKVLDTEFATPSDLTQHCHLSRAIRLLGMDQEPARRELFAELFHLPGQLLHEAAGILGQRPPLADLGGVVRRVLEAIPSTLTGVFESLAIGGAGVGLWPPLHVWRPALHRLVPRVFPAGGRQAAVNPP